MKVPTKRKNASMGLSKGKVRWKQAYCADVVLSGDKAVCWTPVHVQRVRDAIGIHEPTWRGRLEVCGVCNAWMHGESVLEGPSWRAS